jgi:hypothetical protein
MRYLACSFLLTLLFCTTQAQDISYDIPQRYKRDITAAEYKRIVDYAVPIVAKRYKIDQVSGGTIYLNKGQDLKEINLHNLLLKCVTVKDKSLWEKVITAHFDNIFTSIDEQKKIDPANFETISKYLSLRIYPVATVQERGGVTAVIARTDLEGTYTLLMLDLPGAFVPVQKKIFELWKKDTNDVFSIAQANVNKQVVEKVTSPFDAGGVTIEVSFLGNEDYAASYALDLLNNAPEMVGAWGSAICMPNKGLVNICKISKEKPVDFVKFIQRTKPQIEQSYQQHSQPISDEYFWYYKGKFTKIKVLTNADGTINVIAPAGLTALMTEKQ